MDPMTLLALAKAGVAAASSGLEIAGQGMQYRAMKRAARSRTAALQTAMGLATTKAGYQQGQIEDQRDATLARQANFFAGGNIDMTTGSPAILAAQTEALAEQDQLMAAARGAQERADYAGQIAGLWNKVDDARGAMSFNIASSILSAAGKMIGAATESAGRTGTGSGGGSSGAFDILPSASFRSGGNAFSAEPWGLY